MQGTWLQSLARLDFTGHGATKPVCHNCWACTLQNPGAATTEAHTPRSQGFTGENTTMRSPHATTKRSPCLPQLEKAPTQQGSPSTTKTKKKKETVCTNTDICMYTYVCTCACIYWLIHTHTSPSYSWCFSGDSWLIYTLKCIIYKNITTKCINSCTQVNLFSEDIGKILPLLCDISELTYVG